MMREIDLLLNKNLQHMNIVRYFVVFSDEEYLNIIMELCEEGNLENYLKRFEKNIPEEVCE
jgi:serine/threonine protein kinase